MKRVYHQCLRNQECRFSPPTFIIYVLGTLLLKQKKPVISNMGNLFSFNSNVSDLYNNDVMIYIKIKVVRTVLFVTEFT